MIDRGIPSVKALVALTPAAPALQSVNEVGGGTLDALWRSTPVERDRSGM